MGGSSYSLDSPSDLAALLFRRLQRTRKYARRNYYAAYTCYGLAISTSFLATILAVGDKLPPAGLAMVTALPGTALLANSAFSFEKKADWSWRKVQRYDGLLMRLTFESKDVLSVSKDLRTFEEEIEKEYPNFGMMPHVNQPEGK